MAAPGAFLEKSIIIPRWLTVLTIFVIAVFSAGVGFATTMLSRQYVADTNNATLVRGQAALRDTDTMLIRRLGTVEFVAAGLLEGRRQDRQLLSALATLRCIDGTRRDLTRVAGLPCSQLLNRTDGDSVP